MRGPRLQILSTKPLERLNAETTRLTHVADILPNDASITRLLGSLLLAQRDKWNLNRRHMQL